MKGIRVLFVVRCDDFDNQVKREFSKYFGEFGYFERITIDENGKIPTFEHLSAFDVVVVGGHGNSLGKENQIQLGEVLIKILEETETGIVTMMWCCEMDSTYGIGGRWRTEKWNPIESNFSSTCWTPRKLIYRVNDVPFNTFPDMSEVKYNVHIGGLNIKRKVRVIAEWERTKVKEKIYGIVELWHHKSIQLNFHPSNNGGTNMIAINSVDLVLKTVKYIHERPMIVGMKSKMEEQDLNERIDFLRNDDNNQFEKISLRLEDQSEEIEALKVSFLF